MICADLDVYAVYVCQANYYMQNRESTEGYPKSIVRKNNDKFGKGLVSTSRTNASPKRDGTRCLEE